MKKFLIACLLITAMVSCTDPMEETLDNTGGIDGDPITIKG